MQKDILTLWIADQEKALKKEKRNKAIIIGILLCIAGGVILALFYFSHIALPEGLGGTTSNSRNQLIAISSVFLFMAYTCYKARIFFF